MKTALFILLLVSAQAGDVDGTVWYDAKGKVAWVDGPAAEKKAPAPFVPQWVAREERRDRALRGDYRPRGRGADTWPVWDLGYGYGYGYSGGYRYRGGYGGSYRACRSYPSSSFHVTRPSGGVRLIIR
jgi:hypothetical protein